MSTVLILGGARSGKSRYAESLAKGRKFYMATAQASDEEMQQRIDTHRKQRGQGWQTFEAPLDLLGTLQEIDGKGHFILIECLTIWLSNLMLGEFDVRAEVEKLCQGLKKVKARVVLVSNEVGLGIVPANVLARAFRDEQGFANQRIAEIADEVVFITAGLPMVLKKTKRKAKSVQTKKSSRGRKT